MERKIELHGEYCLSKPLLTMILYLTTSKIMLSHFAIATDAATVEKVVHYM